MAGVAPDIAAIPYSQRELFRPIAGALLMLALVLGWWMSAVPAHAHDYLVDSTPASGETYDTAPAQIELEFSADIIPASPALLIQDADLAVVWEGEPELNGRFATAPFPELAAGEYRLNWSLVSSDGHRVEGTIPFTLGSAAASGDGGTAPGTADGETAPGTGDGDGETAPGTGNDAGSATAAVVGDEGTTIPETTTAPTEPISAVDDLPLGARIAIGLGGTAAVAILAALALRRRNGGLRPE
ncbi:MAG TPA: copper resistance CopC family protein [Actinomycetaceae bacterium]|nr:copper resistance CopC family protein [Actinomycetaceae bacterium]